MVLPFSYIRFFAECHEPNFYGYLMFDFAQATNLKLNLSVPLSKSQTRDMYETKTGQGGSDYLQNLDFHL